VCVCGGHEENGYSLRRFVAAVTCIFACSFFTRYLDPTTRLGGVLGTVANGHKGITDERSAADEEAVDVLLLS